MNLNRIFAVATACAMGATCLGQRTRLVAICPWTFEEGNRTSREMVVETVRKIVEHNGLTVLPQERVERRYENLHPAVAFRRGVPVLEDLDRFANEISADVLVFGKASWHTRSIWVGTGPKTVSTATVDLYIYNARSGRISYEQRGAEGRSDEKESGLKDVADVLITPFVSVVSGGPSTPREQRAVQIALGRAMAPWAQKHGRN